MWLSRVEPLKVGDPEREVMAAIPAGWPPARSCRGEEAGVLEEGDACSLGEDECYQNYHRDHEGENFSSVQFIDKRSTCDVFFHNCTSLNNKVYRG